MQPTTTTHGKRQIVFLHIAKTAGTSMSRFLAESFPGQSLYHREAEDFDQARKETIEGFDIVQGHISYLHLKKMREDRFLFTFVRSPADRVLSIYGFLRERHHPLDAANPSSPFVLAKTHDLAAFLTLKNPAVQALVSNHQTYALGMDWRSRGRLHDSDVLERARKTLKEMDFVGLTEEFDASLTMLSSLLGVRRPSGPLVENATRSRLTLKEIGKKERALINQLNQLDLSIYRYAKRLYRIRRARFVITESWSQMKAMFSKWASRREKGAALPARDAFETLMSELWIGNPFDSAAVSPLPYDAQEDWGRDNQELRSFVQAMRPRTIIEVGTWKGCSAMAMCQTLKLADIDPIILCVDTWGGLPEWQAREESVQTDRGFPTTNALWSESLAKARSPLPVWPGEIGTFDQFASNVVTRNMSLNIVPVPMDGRFAATWFSQNDVVPDLVLLDASHDQAENLEMMSSYWSLLKAGGAMIGMDYHPTHPGVISAVHEFSSQHSVMISFRGNMWFARK